MRSWLRKAAWGGRTKNGLLLKELIYPYSIILVSVNRAIKENILPHKQELSGVLPVMSVDFVLMYQTVSGLCPFLYVNYISNLKKCAHTLKKIAVYKYEVHNTNMRALVT